MSTAPTKSVPGSRPYWPLIAGACLVPALLSAFTAYMNSRFSGRGSADWGAVIFESVEWLFFGALTPIAYVLARRYPLRRGALGRAVAAHLAGALLLCIGWASPGMLLGMHLRAKEFAGSGAKLVRLEFPKTEIQVYGNTVVIYTTYLIETESGGRRTTKSGRGTEVFVRRGDDLVNVGWHLDSGK